MIGKWQTIYKKQPPVILEITTRNISRLENGKRIIYNNYYLCDDTLILINTNFKEKHLIEVLTGSKLRLGSVTPYKKDIELLDAVEFEK